MSDNMYYKITVGLEHFPNKTNYIYPINMDDIDIIYFENEEGARLQDRDNIIAVCETQTPLKISDNIIEITFDEVIIPVDLIEYGDLIEYDDEYTMGDSEYTETGN